MGSTSAAVLSLLPATVVGSGAFGQTVDPVEAQATEKGCGLGRLAPSFRLPNVNPDAPGERETSLANLLAAPGTRFVLVSFVSSYCPPCDQEMPAIKALHDRFSKGGALRVVAIGAVAGEPDRDLAAFSKRHGLRFPVLNSARYGPVVRARYLNSDKAIPSTFLVDRKGRIVWCSPRLDLGLESAVSRVIEASYP